MDIWTDVQTILEKNPGLRAKYLIQELREKTGLGRSMIYDHLHTFHNQNKIYREKGRYYLPHQLRARILFTSKSKEEKVEKFFSEQVYWQHKLLEEPDIQVICNQLGLHPEHDRGLIYEVHARHLRDPSL